MIIYHGTLIENAESIVRSGLIDVCNSQNTQYKDNSENYRTSFGYVYLSTSVNEALGFALIASMKHTESIIKEVAIFEIDVKDVEIEDDQDEQRISAHVTNVVLPPKTCKMINRPLYLGKDCIRYCFMKFQNIYEGLSFADDEHLHEKIEPKWIDYKNPNKQVF